MKPEQSTDKPNYGGQAVIEGVMMRGRNYYAVACRRANGEIVVQQESVESATGKLKWLNKPFLRGTFVMLDAIILGMKALMYSADIAMADAQPNAPSDVDKKAESADGSGNKDSNPGKTAKQKRSINDIAVGATVVLGLGLGVLIFIVTPQFLVGLLQKSIRSSILLNLTAGIVKLAMFVLYIAVISTMKDIRRVFEYHGAEHKVINTYEAGLDLVPENLNKHTTIHPRCGTSFILVVLVTSIVVFCFLGWQSNILIRVIERLLLLPVVAGIAYEIIRYAGKHKESRLLRTLTAPGLLLQRLTTKEPSEDQIEVALTALRAVFDKENEKAEDLSTSAPVSAVE